MILSVLFHNCFLKEVRVRFIGFGTEEDEWVNIKKAVRGRSIPFEHSECCKVMVGDLVLCLQVTIKIPLIVLNNLLTLLLLNLQFLAQYLGEKRPINLLRCSGLGDRTENS